ncbi:MAG: hypothetical protein IOMNBAOH_02287 [Rhodocyclaceae bacterium]|nr:hypothetical protein [Rhodocyclaceae bacterium]
MTHNAPSSLCVRERPKPPSLADELELERARRDALEQRSGLGSWYWWPAEGRFEVTPGMRRLYGRLDPMDRIEDLLVSVHPDDCTRLRSARAWLRDGSEYSMLFRVATNCGTWRTLHEQTEIEFDHTGKPFRVLGIAEDVSERLAMEDRIGFLTHRDSLTGLLQLHSFREQLATSLARSARIQAHSALMSVKLIGLKRINDGLGHAVGDRVLAAVADRMTACVRSADLLGQGPTHAKHPIGRSGSDAFLVCLSDLRRPEDSARVAERMTSALTEPVVIDGHQLCLSSHIGIAHFPDNGEDADTLMRHAEAALQDARQHAPNSFSFFTDAMNALSQDRLQLEADLREALSCDQLRLVYQSKVDFLMRRIVGAEALLRWQHPTRGMVSPAVVIPVAEETGLIVPIGAWAIRTACAQLCAWRDAGLPESQVSVNLSAPSFADAQLIPIIDAALADFAIAPGQLCIEVTESTLMGDSHQVLDVLLALKARGVSLSVDDFGTGYSSLSYLKRLPLDELKIDRSFIMDLPADGHGAAITAAIIGLSRVLNYDVVAEGVENSDQANFLVAHGCTNMQGFMFSRPVDADEMGRFLADPGRLFGIDHRPGMGTRLDI